MKISNQPLTATHWLSDSCHNWRDCRLSASVLSSLCCCIPELLHSMWCLGPCSQFFPQLLIMNVSNNTFPQFWVSQIRVSLFWNLPSFSVCVWLRGARGLLIIQVRNMLMVFSDGWHSNTANRTRQASFNTQPWCFRHPNGQIPNKFPQKIHVPILCFPHTNCKKYLFKLLHLLSLAFPLPS